jgi:hypothetical protein
MFRELSWRSVNRRTLPERRSDLISLLGLLLAALLGGLAWASREPRREQPPGQPVEQPVGKPTPTQATHTPSPPTDSHLDEPGHVPPSIVAASLLWLAVLVASFVCYERIDGFADFVAFRLGKLPFEAIWFGAVGGWLISAQGIFEFNREWLHSYDYWHYLRPAVGAIIGTLGCLVFIVLNEAATKGPAKPNAVFYDVIALAVGYREESFRKLLQKVFDSIILPGKSEPDKSPPIQPTPPPPPPQPGPRQATPHDAPRH